MATQLSHDPFARTSLRRVAMGAGDCHWCGTYRATLYSYTPESDDQRSASRTSGKRFCNIECFRSYSS